jgi:CBS domain-containing protein
MVKRMREHDLASLPVTTSDGRLVGLLVREDAERALSRLDNSQ